MNGAGWVASVLVVTGVLVTTVAIYGVVRMPDLYIRLHSAGKAVVLGIASLALASVGTLQLGIIVRALLVAALLLLTSPVSAHAIARAAYLIREPMAAQDAVDESGHLRPGPDGEQDPPSS